MEGKRFAINFVTLATIAIGILVSCANAQQAIDSTSPASSSATMVNDLAAVGAFGGVSLVTLLAAAGCFLIGCCGSPMLAIYVSLFGSKAAGIGKPLMALSNLEFAAFVRICFLPPR